MEKLTDRARKVMSIAEREARRRGATAVEPEHVLLGLALEGAGIAAHVLSNLGVSTHQLVQELPVPLTELPDSSELLPWALGTQQLVEQAHAERGPLRHNYVGTEHLILAVVDVASGPIPAMLSHLGLTAEQVRREVYDILGYGL